MSVATPPSKFTLINPEIEHRARTLASPNPHLREMINARCCKEGKKVHGVIFRYAIKMLLQIKCISLAHPPLHCEVLSRTTLPEKNYVTNGC